MFIKIEDVIAIFFFFKAEDGIRVYKVTGVQTCALPISSLDPTLLLLGARVRLGRLRHDGGLEVIGQRDHEMNGSGSRRTPREPLPPVGGQPAEAPERFLERVHAAATSLTNSLMVRNRPPAARNISMSLFTRGNVLERLL